MGNVWQLQSNICVKHCTNSMIVLYQICFREYRFPSGLTPELSGGSETMLRDGTSPHDGVDADLPAHIRQESTARQRSKPNLDGYHDAIELAMGTGDPQRVGSFRFYID